MTLYWWCLIFVVLLPDSVRLLWCELDHSGTSYVTRCEVRGLNPKVP